MANTCYDNFFLSNEIEDQYQSHYFDQRNGYGGAVASGLWNGLGTDCNHTPGEPAGQCLAKVF